MESIVHVMRGARRGLREVEELFSLTLQNVR